MIPVMFFEETLGFLQLGTSTPTHMNSNRSLMIFSNSNLQNLGYTVYRMPDSRLDPMLVGPQNISTQQNGLFSPSYSCDPYSATNILTKCWHILRHSAISSDSFWHMYNIFGTLLWQFLSQYIYIYIHIYIYISSIWLTCYYFFQWHLMTFIYTVSARQFCWHIFWQLPWIQTAPGGTRARDHGRRRCEQPPMILGGVSTVDGCGREGNPNEIAKRTIPSEFHPKKKYIRFI